ncbi:sigma-70 family RNA polymerase sigma factor [Ornithinimicrobium pratense]|uniref:Sigma-70 family RNA polymerase sigma factor n=1 Tax=Ornithinimicrobium pratense TaxID=2593973 RepID=A0A5J6VAX4_9MICO|nr:sigma-70 family RNA polymerase sigma factor [Ornithinimicrobium pratense]
MTSHPAQPPGSDPSTAGAARSSGAAPLDSLLGQVGRGDRAAFADLYDAVAPRLYGLAQRVVRDAAIAEEVTQEVFLQVWREADRFSPARGSALAWLLTLTHRRSVDRVRSEQAQSDRLHRYESHVTSVPYDTTAEEAVGRVEAGRVRTALDLVGEPHRTALQLAYLEGLTHREVAQQTGVPLGTAKTRIRDGLHKIRHAMTGGEQ